MIYFCYIPFDFDFDCDFYMNYSFSSIIFYIWDNNIFRCKSELSIPDAFIYFLLKFTLI
jgi:hypothetical protein